MPTTARVARIHEYGPPEVLRFEDIVVDEPGDDEALIRNTVIGLNFVDIYYRRGSLPVPYTGLLVAEPGPLRRRRGIWSESSPVRRRRHFASRCPPTPIPSKAETQSLPANYVTVTFLAVSPAHPRCHSACFTLHG